MSEAEFDVDAAEAEFDAAKAAREAGEAEQAAAAGAEDDAGGDGGEREDPPTYMTHDEWVAAGRDPEDYIGKRAFQKRHDDIQDNKKLRRELKTMGATVKQTMDAVQQWQGTEREKIRTELEAELHAAKENEDVNAAIETQKKLDKLDDEPAPAAAVEESPVIQDFREDNPMLDPDAEEFNPEFHADLRAIYNDMAKKLGGSKGALTDGQIARCLKRALKETNELHEIEPAAKPAGDKGESPRNKRATTQQRTTRRNRNKAEDTPKAEDYDLKDRLSHNPRDGNAATEIRETIRLAAEDNARRNGKDDAAIKKEGDEAATNFERSIA